MACDPCPQTVRWPKHWNLRKHLSQSNVPFLTAEALRAPKMLIGTLARRLSLLRTANSGALELRVLVFRNDGSYLTRYAGRTVLVRFPAVGEMGDGRVEPRFHGPQRNSEDFPDLLVRELVEI